MARQPRRARHQPSTIDKLDPQIRQMITTLRVDYGWSIDDILQRLLEMGQSVSRSALGRHVRTIEDVGAELRETQVFAEALARETGNKQGAQLLDMNSQLLQSNMFKMMLAVRDGESVTLTTKEAKEFSEALRNTAILRKTEFETDEKAEERGARRERIAAADRATKTARSKGLSKETVDAIRHSVLGSDA